MKRADETHPAAAGAEIEAASLLSVTPDVWTLFPGLHVVVTLAMSLTVTEAWAAEVSRAWTDEWRAAGAMRVNAPQQHPRVSAWRRRMSASGVSGQKFPSSIEALLRRALKGGQPPRISTLVDLYNRISLRHVVPAGGFDFDELGGRLELRTTHPGDHFVPLDGDTIEHPVRGEVCYAIGDEILTRHFVWRQSRSGLIRSQTTNALFVAEIPGDVVEAEPSLPDKVRTDFEQWLQPVARDVTSADISAPA